MLLGYPYNDKWELPITDTCKRNNDPIMLVVMRIFLLDTYILCILFIVIKLFILLI